MRSPWARQYARTPHEYVWGTDPSDFARRVSGLVQPGARVLDLGCGEGRDSVFFASLGCDVTGVEVSRAGLRKAERLARARGTTVRWVHGDMARLSGDSPFDLVYSCGAVHYVARAERARLLPRLKTLTAPGGHHALIVFTDALVYVEMGEVIDYFAPGELRRAYADWRVLADELEVIDCARDGTPHRHSVQTLIAQATGGSPP